MYMVYWTVVNETHMTSEAQEFASSDMASALKFMEALRARQHAGESIRFITMASENPESVGRAGAADPAPDYDWKKRRR
jgi:hypothetical protein